MGVAVPIIVGVAAKYAPIVAAFVAGHIVGWIRHKRKMAKAQSAANKPAAKTN